MKTFAYYCDKCKTEGVADFGLINYNPKSCGSEYITECDCGNLLTEVEIEASGLEIDRDKPACLCADCAQAQLESPYRD